MNSMQGVAIAFFAKNLSLLLTVITKCQERVEKKNQPFMINHIVQLPF